MDVAGVYECIQKLGPVGLQLCKGTDAGARYALTSHPLLSPLPPLTLRSLERVVAQLRCLRHPHLLTVVDAVLQRDALTLVLSPPPTSYLLRRVFHSTSRRPPPRETRMFFRQMAFTLHYCHTRGVAHGNLSPHDLLLTSGDAVCVLGMGCLDLPPRTRVARLELDPWELMYNFAPPETKCAKGDHATIREVLTTHSARAAADRYALGALLYAMVKGRNFTEEADAFAEFPPVPSNVMDDESADVDALITSLLQKDPHKRASLSSVMATNWFVGTLPGRRESQELVELTAEPVPQYLTSSTGDEADPAGYEASVTALLAAKTTTGMDGAVLKQQDLRLNFFGTIADCVAVLKTGLGCHVHGNKTLAREIGAANSTDPEDWVFEVLRMRADGGLLHFRIQAQAGSMLDMSVAGMESVTSSKQLWSLRFTPIRATDAALGGLMAQLRRALPSTSAGSGDHPHGSQSHGSL